MARSIFCGPCGLTVTKINDQHGEKYRAVWGYLNRLHTSCDHCGQHLPHNERVMAFTTHPKGPDAIGPWEQEYIVFGEDD